MKKSIETKRPLKVEYQEFEGGKSPKPFDILDHKFKKGNIVTKDEYGNFQFYDDMTDFERYHGDLEKACDGDNTSIVTKMKDYVFIQEMPKSAPCEAYFKVQKRVNGDYRSTVIEKLVIEKNDKETTEERIQEICSRVEDIQDELREDYNEQDMYYNIVVASFEGSILGKGSIKKGTEDIELTREFYDEIPNGFKTKLQVNAIRLMSMQASELGN